MVVEAGHVEASIAGLLVDAPVEAAAAEHLALQRVEPLLPAGYAGVGGSTMLDEVQRTALGAAPVASRPGRARRRGWCTGSKW